MDVLYKRGRGTVTEVMGEMPEPPGYSAVRSMLRILEEKGHIRHQTDGAKYVYLPTLNRDKAKRSAIRHLLQTFFDGSAGNAVAALLDESSSRLSEKEFNRLEGILKKARKGGKA